MPGYIKAALHKYQHPAPAHPEHAPHGWNPPIYGAKMQFVSDPTPSPTLSDKDVNNLQQLTRTLLYYARAVDPTLIMPINVLASEQSNATEVTADKVIKLLNYYNTHPESKIRYHASEMILHIHSDASYLSENEAKSRAAGFFYMGNATKNDKKLTNGAILIVSKVQGIALLSTLVSHSPVGSITSLLLRAAMEAALKEAGCGPSPWQPYFKAILQVMTKTWTSSVATSMSDKCINLHHNIRMEVYSQKDSFLMANFIK
jgi:hypothetical protein